MVAATLLPLVARADLVGGVTEVVDQTSGTTTDTVNGTVGDTGMVVDELTGTVDQTSDALTNTVESTPEDVSRTVDDTLDLLGGGATTPDPDSSAGSPATTIPVGPTTTTVAPAVSSADIEASDEESAGVAVSGGGGEDREDGAAAATDGLTVLSAAGGLTDMTVLEPVSIEAIVDDSLYGRLLSWLSGAGSGLLGLLAGPLLAFEILLRALLSAGSGLVAPASLLASYLVRLVWETRRRQLAVPA